VTVSAESSMTSSSGGGKGGGGRLDALTLAMLATLLALGRRPRMWRRHH
jgi:hypothetical protein